MEETRGIPDVIAAVNHPSAAFGDLMASDGALEGMTAFTAKRPRARATANRPRRPPWSWAVRAK